MKQDKKMTKYPEFVLIFMTMSTHCRVYNERRNSPVRTFIANNCQ